MNCFLSLNETRYCLWRGKREFLKSGNGKAQKPNYYAHYTVTHTIQIPETTHLKQMHICVSWSIGKEN